MAAKQGMPAILDGQSTAYKLDQKHGTANSCCCHKCRSRANELAPSLPPKHPPNHLPPDILPAKSKSNYITRDRVYMMTKMLVK